MIIALAGKAGVGKDTFADFVQSNLSERHSVTRLGFADPVRAMAKSLFNLSDKEITDRALKEKKIERSVLFSDVVPGSYGGFNDYLMIALTRAFGSDPSKWPRTKAYLVNTLANFLVKHVSLGDKGIIYRKSPRELMQLIGTEFGRDKVGENVWIDCFKRRVKSITDNSEAASNTIILVTDCRFRNESDAVHADDYGIVIKLYRETEKCDNSAHRSEEIDVQYDYVYSNNGDLLEFEDQVIDFLYGFGLLA